MIGTDTVILVDQFDNKIGLQDKQQAHIDGALHRAFSVFIFNSNNQLLLQQRQADKYHCANLWTNTCCSHPRDNELIVDAARRRLLEELNLACNNLQVIGSFIYKASLDTGLIEHEYDYVLVGHSEQKLINVNLEEVQDYKWVSIEELLSWLKAKPTDFTPWFNLALDKILQWLEESHIK